MAIQGHSRLLILRSVENGKPTKDYTSVHNNVDLISKDFEDIAAKSTEYCRFSLTPFDAPSPGKPYIVRN